MVQFCWFVNDLGLGPLWNSKIVITYNSIKCEWTICKFHRLDSIDLHTFLGRDTHLTHELQLGVKSEAPCTRLNPKSKLSGYSEQKANLQMGSCSGICIVSKSNWVGQAGFGGGNHSVYYRYFHMG